MTTRHALVIGASSGIGAATSLRLAKDGWKVTAVARRTPELSALEEENPRLSGLTLDVTDRAALLAAVESLPAVDAMIYAAGLNVPEREIEVLSVEDWKAIFEVNVNGAFHAAQALLPSMRSAGGGLMVFVSSISAERADPSGVAYQSSKRAMHGLAEGILVEERENGIRAALIMPGLTRTDFNLKRRTPPTEEDREKFLTPEDVAESISFVCNLPSHVMIPYLTVVPTANPWNK